MNYQIGDRVIHCRNGLSMIVNVVDMNENKYFVVQLVGGDGANFYVPVERADSIIRKLLTKKEADELLEKIKDSQFEYTPNTKQRRDLFKKRLGSGKVEDIGYLYRIFYVYKNTPNMKLGPVDISLLEDASRMFLDELSITYGVDRDKIDDYLIKKMAK